MPETYCRSCAVLAAVAAAMPLLAGGAQAATLVVGPGQSYATIGGAIAAAQNGDTIDVLPGVYVNDFASIAQDITLIAVGGRVTMMATERIPNGAGILLIDGNVAITGFSFIGAKVTDADGANGAGIRYEGGNLVLTDCYFANNQEGMLADPDPTGTITIQSSEFFHNGAKTGPSAGYTHNLYVNQIATLDIENSYIHAANIGHEIKSRADVTIVRDTRIVDGPTGTSSYSVDMPNGGVGIIENDQIEQGPLGQNPIMIAFGEEGNVLAGSTLTVSDDLIENDLNSPDAVAVWNAANLPRTVTVTHNNAYGLTKPQMLYGAGTLYGTNYMHHEPQISRKHPWQQ